MRPKNALKSRTGAACNPRTPVGVRFSLASIPGVTRCARPPLANLPARLRRAKHSPKGCQELSPGLSEATPRVVTQPSRRIPQGCEDNLDRCGFEEGSLHPA